MAVLDSCPGLEVKILSDNKALKEHADIHAANAPKTVTNYVEVEADGAFQVRLQFSDRYACKFGVRVEIRLDGHKVYGGLYRPSMLKKAAGHTCAGTRSKIRGKWHVSNLLFAQFALGKWHADKLIHPLICAPDTNNDQELDQATTDRLRSSCVITVLVHRIKNIRARAVRRTTRAAGDQAHGISKLGRVPEKVVKDLGLSHHGRFAVRVLSTSRKLTVCSIDKPGQEKGARNSCYTDVDGSGDEHAIAIFNFKYRSLGEFDFHTFKLR